MCKKRVSLKKIENGRLVFKCDLVELKSIVLTWLASYSVFGQNAFTYGLILWKYNLYILFKEKLHGVKYNKIHINAQRNENKER